MKGESANSTAPVRVRVGTCLADGGSILAVDLTGSTGDQVQLVGSLVAKPFVTTTGADAYLFRGNVTQLEGTAAPGGRLPWGLPGGFVAEVQIQPNAKSGNLTVVFSQPETQVPGTAATTPSAPAPVISRTDLTGTPTGTDTPPAATSSSGTSPGMVSGGSHSTL